MSFATGDDVMEVIGDTVRTTVTAATGDAAPPIPRITWRESMTRFGTDKPDLRVTLEIVDVTEVFAADRVPCLPGRRGPGAVRSRRRRARPGATRRADRTGPALGAQGLVWMQGRVTAPTLDSPGRQAFLRPERLGLLDGVRCPPSTTCSSSSSGRPGPPPGARRSSASNSARRSTAHDRAAGVGRRLPTLRGRRRRRATDPRPPPVRDAPSRRPAPPRDRARRRAARGPVALL